MFEQLQIQLLLWFVIKITSNTTKYIFFLYTYGFWILMVVITVCQLSLRTEFLVSMVVSPLPFLLWIRWENLFQSICFSPLWSFICMLFTCFILTDTNNWSEARSSAWWCYVWPPVVWPWRYSGWLGSESTWCWFLIWWQCC